MFKLLQLHKILFIPLPICNRYKFICVPSSRQCYLCCYHWNPISLSLSSSIAINFYRFFTKSSSFQNYPSPQINLVDIYYFLIYFVLFFDMFDTEGEDYNDPNPFFGMSLRDCIIISSDLFFHLQFFNQHLPDMMSSMICHLTSLEPLQGEALRTVAYIFIRIPTKATTKIPYKLLNG